MPRFSVCIPTRERHATLPHSIRTVLAQSYRDFELIVQDNCSSPETERAVRQFDDPRIIYQRSNERLSMHENWERALDATSGDLVLFLGDDDGLLGNCLAKAAELCSDPSVELLAWLAHTYYWPNVPDAKRRNHLSLDLRSASSWAHAFAPEKSQIDRGHEHPALPAGVFCLSSRQLLKNWLGHRGVRVYVPAYHNVVSRSVIDRVRAMTGGRYFFNPLPDFGTLIANLYAAREVLFYAAPLSMTGHAGGSSGGTHGDLESWTRTLNRFMEEAKVGPRDLLPSVFEPFTWSPALLAGCFENVKAALFPDDADLRLNWENFLREAAAQVEGEPVAVRAHCRDWVRASAQRIGVDPDGIRFPPVPEWRRQVGFLFDPEGRAQYQYMDGDRLGLETIVDAVRVAEQFQPIALYPTSIPQGRATWLTTGPSVPGSTWSEPHQPGRTVRRVLRRLAVAGFGERAARAGLDGLRAIRSGVRSASRSFPSRRSAPRCAP